MEANEDAKFPLLNQAQKDEDGTNMIGGKKVKVIHQVLHSESARATFLDIP